MIGTREENIHNLRQVMRHNTELATAIFEVMNKIDNGEIKSKLLLDSIVQRWERFELDELDVFYFCKVYAGIVKGKIGLIEIEMYKKPQSDKMIAENNKILSTLPYPFYAKFTPTTGRGDSDDGLLGWSTKINFETQFHSEEGRINKNILVNEDSIPLEIGYTEAMTTYFHIYQHGGVARYPYNDTKLLIFYNNGINLNEDMYF